MEPPMPIKEHLFLKVQKLHISHSKPAKQFNSMCLNIFSLNPLSLKQKATKDELQ